LFSDNKPKRQVGLEGDFKSKSLKEIKSFIENNIEIFKKKYNTTTKEKGLNQQFVVCMNNQIRDEKFFFHHEYIEDISRGDSAQVDIAIIPRESQKASFVLEAKRLDSSLPKYREKEYIIRDGGGGIERFKKEIHGNELVYVGMIGYIQTDDFDSWLAKINKYISEEISSSTSIELIWEEKDKLILDKKNQLFSTYISEHKCKSKEISMYHIWINLK